MWWFEWEKFYAFSNLYPLLMNCSWDMYFFLPCSTMWQNKRKVSSIKLTLGGTYLLGWAWCTNNEWDKQGMPSAKRAIVHPKTELLYIYIYTPQSNNIANLEQEKQKTHDFSSKIALIPFYFFLRKMCPPHFQVFDPYYSSTCHFAFHCWCKFSRVHPRGFFWHNSMAVYLLSLQRC